ncbi:Cu(I)-responsive transcriptional regulator [Saccharibacter sp. 17.LH.SD]|uniref:Cu(I)-responsive transcriptional regulator n=1 Tax=Saccharibacter sp. 17.LH.SD TaxID=2689393 RepID=UPI0013711A72|nr:Cu(I)-responsive transcriptional regulator [Saccharibacter sp. 17.LH.SD]MXV45007.1 Cu(I)-responsive transcriptional regulator [Saccharibacter sp. 17.LH.SD]
MNIGQASRETGVSIKMIRYYEQTGLIPPVARNQAGYRHYSENDLHRLRFIRRARDLGFSIKHIAILLSLWQNHDRENAQVRDIANQHISGLQNRITEMEAMITTLQKLVDECAGQDRPECPILTDLEH